MIGIKDNYTVLDVGCGVGGPAREIATFAGCKVVGVNNNGYQIERATALTAKRGLSDKVSFVKDNFMVCMSLSHFFKARTLIPSCSI